MHNSNHKLQKIKEKKKGYKENVVALGTCMDLPNAPTTVSYLLLVPSDVSKMFGWVLKFQKPHLIPTMNSYKSMTMMQAKDLV